MHPMSARAFLAQDLTRNLRSDILKTIRDYELSGILPPGRYLVGGEIGMYLKRIAKKNPKNQVELTSPTEEDIMAMDKLWFEYERTILVHAHQFEDEHPEITPRSRIEDIHAWEDWVCRQISLDQAVVPY